MIVAALIASAVLAGCGAEPPAGSDGSAPTRTTSGSSPPRAAEPFREDFDDPSALERWELRPGDFSSAPPVAEVIDGQLQVRSAHASWLDENEAFGLARAVSGDVDVIARVRTSGTASERPTVDWSLAGLMLRDPAPGPADWIHWTVGEVDGPVLERKRTSTGRSILDLTELPDGGPVDLRLVRQGDVVVLAYRQRDEPWTVAYDYTWVDMPPTVELLVTAQSGGEGDHADLVARTDFVDVAPATFDDADVELLRAGDPAPLNR